MIKKKIKDLSFEECQKICDNIREKHYEKHEKYCCDEECPLFESGKFLCQLYILQNNLKWRKKSKKYLERVVEVLP